MSGPTKTSNALVPSTGGNKRTPPSPSRAASDTASSADLAISPVAKDTKAEENRNLKAVLAGTFKSPAFAETILSPKEEKIANNAWLGLGAALA